MLEVLISPKKAEREPWELFFIGAFYASVAFLLVTWIFSRDAVLVKYSGILTVTFTVMFSIPFMYYMIRYEEKKVTRERSMLGLLREHERAIWAFLWLFVGFVVAFSFWYHLVPTTQGYRAQIETFCTINRPESYNACLQQFGGSKAVQQTAFAGNKERLFLIFANNIYVLIFTLVFSLVFGAGVIFILAWNASVIAAAIAIFTNSELAGLPLGLLRYLVHGIPEIAAYFIAALAGGIVSVAVIRHQVGSEDFWEILQDSLNLIILSVVVLFIAALMEVFLTPLLFSF